MVRITPIYEPWKGHLEGKQPYLGDLLTMVINHLLTGMILQVGCPAGSDRNDRDRKLVYLQRIYGIYNLPL